MNFFKKIKNKNLFIIITIFIIATSIYVLTPIIRKHFVSKKIQILTLKSITKKQLESAKKIAFLPKEIIGKIITLKKLEKKYFQAYHQAFSEKVREMIEYPKNISFAFTKALLEYDMKKAAKGTMVLYLIFDNKEDKLIGEIEIKDPNPKEPGQLSDWINENYWGGGRFQEALDLITKVYFKYKNANKYTARTRIWNKRSYHAHKKFGFKDVGYIYEDDKPSSYKLEFYNPYKKKQTK